MKLGTVGKDRQVSGDSTENASASPSTSPSPTCTTYDLPEGEAHRISETLCESLTEEVNTSYPGWWKKTDARRDIKVQIYQTLGAADTSDDLDLVKVGSELRDYLITNYVDDPNR